MTLVAALCMQNTVVYAVEVNDFGDLTENEEVDVLEEDEEVESDPSADIPSESEIIVDEIEDDEQQNDISQQIDGEEIAESNEAEVLFSSGDEQNITEETINDISDFTYKELNGSYITITGYTGSATDVTIPKTIGEYTVQEIAGRAFENLKIESVILPNTVKKIGNEAFSNCNLLNLVLYDQD